MLNPLLLSLTPGGLEIIHPPVLLAQYMKYQSSMSEIPPMFLALLFAIVTLSLKSYYLREDAPAQFSGTTMELTDFYREKTAQALRMADITSRAQYTLEALLLYMVSGRGMNAGTETGLWMLMGIIVRVAYDMGYHRYSPQLFPILQSRLLF
jgi:hypothetical protein